MKSVSGWYRHPHHGSGATAETPPLLKWCNGLMGGGTTPKIVYAPQHFHFLEWASLPSQCLSGYDSLDSPLMFNFMPQDLLSKYLILNKKKVIWS